MRYLSLQPRGFTAPRVLMLSSITLVLVPAQMRLLPVCNRFDPQIQKGISAGESCLHEGT